jgi:xylulose-5-phosphate/fructose-6-phosphate phosphoketolase
MTGPVIVDEKNILGSFRAHQVPLPNAKSDPGQLTQLSEWLGSYDIHSLVHSRASAPAAHSHSHHSSHHSRQAHTSELNPDALFTDEVTRILPRRVDRRMGMIKETYNGYESLDVPEFQEFVSKKPEKDQSPMKAIGGASRVVQPLGIGARLRFKQGLLISLCDTAFLQEVVKRNPKSFRIFSPDGASLVRTFSLLDDHLMTITERPELGSNKLDSVFSITCVECSHSLKFDVAWRVSELC